MTINFNKKKKQLNRKTRKTRLINFEKNEIKFFSMSSDSEISFNNKSKFLS